MVRAKFTLGEIRTSESGYNGQKYGETKTFVFQPVYDPNLPEDQRFSKATPCGRLEMQVDNPAAIEQLKLGQTFYLDFVPVEAAST